MWLWKYELESKLDEILPNFPCSQIFVRMGPWFLNHSTIGKWYQSLSPQDLLLSLESKNCYDQSKIFRFCGENLDGHVWIFSIIQFLDSLSNQTILLLFFVVGHLYLAVFFQKSRLEDFPQHQIGVSSWLFRASRTSTILRLFQSFSC